MNNVLMFAGHTTPLAQKRLLLALLPVAAAYVWFFGLQILLNVALSCLFGITFEALARMLRGLPGRDLLRDEHTLIVSCLFGLCLPPGTLWWQLALGMAFAMLLVKHAYGGFGQHPFNPAMAALLLLWSSFPETTQNWPMPYQTEASSIALTSGAADISPWPWINILTLIAGIYLLAVRAVAWQIPAGMLAVLALLPWLHGGAGTGTTISDSLAQLFYGGTMITAFFIATDPASSAMTRLGKLYYGLLTGCTLYLIRIWGEWPEGYAAAVILANFFAPLLDQFVQRPRYGSGRKLLTESPSEPTR